MKQREKLDELFNWIAQNKISDSEGEFVLYMDDLTEELVKLFPDFAKKGVQEDDGIY